MKDFIKSLKPTAEAGLRTGVAIAAAAAPVILVLAAASWIKKKD